jgi:hypothetical protein
MNSKESLHVDVDDDTPAITRQDDATDVCFVQCKE